MSRRDEGTTRQEEESIRVDVFHPEDAEGIVELFRSVYGDGYPIRLFYDPEAVVAANRDGRYISIVARADSGRVVGVNHLYHSAPCPALYEIGVALVAKEYRRGGAFMKLSSYLCDEYIPRNPHVEEAFGESVCNHIVTQRASAAFGFKETAIEVALMPAEAYTRERSASGRVATMDSFRCYVQRPHRVHLPAVYEPILRRILGHLASDRDVVISGEDSPMGVATRAESSIFEYARVARITIREAGHDFTSSIAALEDQARSKGVVVCQAFLDLAQPCVGWAAEALRDRGYFFGGLLPRWFDSDGLLMQRLECPPDFDGILLSSDFSKELLQFVRQDREQILKMNR